MSEISKNYETGPLFSPEELEEKREEELSRIKEILSSLELNFGVQVIDDEEIENAKLISFLGAIELAVKKSPQLLSDKWFFLTKKANHLGEDINLDVNQTLANLEDFLKEISKPSFAQLSKEKVLERKENKIKEGFKKFQNLVLEEVGVKISAPFDYATKIYKDKDLQAKILKAVKTDVGFWKDRHIIFSGETNGHENYFSYDISENPDQAIKLIENEPKRFKETLRNIILLSSSLNLKHSIKFKFTPQMFGEEAIKQNGYSIYNLEKILLKLSSYADENAIDFKDTNINFFKERGNKLDFYKGQAWGRFNYRVYSPELIMKKIEEIVNYLKKYGN